MAIWNAIRYTPRVSPQAMVWATMSFATYLAADEMRPVLCARTLDPLSLALAVQMTLVVAQNMTSTGFAAIAKSKSDIWFLSWSVFWGISFIGLFALIAFTGNASTAAKLFMLHSAVHAVLRVLHARYETRIYAPIVGNSLFSKEHTRNAVYLEAVGMAITTVLLWSAWTFGGPLHFAAMMSFGVLIVKFLYDWGVVLYLLNVLSERPDE